MEALKARLQFEDLPVRARSIRKLTETVKRKSRGEIITSSTASIPELNFIWETCIRDSPVANHYRSANSQLAVTGIVELVKSRHLDANFAVNKLLGTISSSDNIYNVVKGITQLLRYQMVQTSHEETLPFSMHRPKHPLIVVLEYKTSYLPLVLENIADTICEDGLRGFQLMEPVICYILSHPSKIENSGSKISLLETLIDSIEVESSTAFYILRCIPFLQVESYDQVVEAANFIFKAHKCFSSVEFERSNHIYISELLLLSSISVSERSLEFGHNPTRLLNISLKMSRFLATIDFNSSYSNLCLILIAMTLKSATGKLIDKYSEIAMNLLDFRNMSPTVCAYLSFSAIQLLPESSVISFGEEASESRLPQLLKKLGPYILSCQNVEDASHVEIDAAAQSAYQQSKDENTNFIQTFTFSVQSSMHCVKFALKLDEMDLKFRFVWLKRIRDIVECSSEGNLDVIFSLVATFFLMCPDNPENLSVCLETIESVLKKETHLSTRIFALLLYKQNLLKLPESKFLILQFLPKSATHKYAIPPVLSILKLMSTNADLKSQSIQLMLQLWKQNDRCFSYLHQLLLENNKTSSNGNKINDALLSQTVAIREICSIAPEKHGRDFLGVLSRIFNEANDEASSPIACLALDGVISMCKSEITDLRSTWKVLGPKLSKDHRTLVMCRMYKLLSLVPELQVKSVEYDKFMGDVVANTWKRISAGTMPPEAVSEAYKALAVFPYDSHTLKLLPSQAKCNLQLPVSMKATPFDMGKLPEDVLTYIPGYCFVDLLKSIDHDIVIEGYTEFLNAMIKTEVSELPRSVYSKQQCLRKQQKGNEVLAKVPKFLSCLFETRKSPSLQKNLAVGVLLCFEPPMEYGRDGEPIKRSLASQYRFYENILSVLLNDVNIDTTEWQRCILLPSAWGAFMERAFFGCEESRRAELELQNHLGHVVVTPEELNLQSKSCWLWVRDRLLTVIKTSVRNGATAHANAVFAMAGLVYASNKFQLSLDENLTTSTADERTFLEEYADTILCAMMTEYQPKGNVHSWLLTHLSRQNSSSGFLIRGCGYSSLCYLTPVLISTHMDDIPKIFEDLLLNLKHNSPVLRFYSGLGLGLFIRSLCDAGYADLGDAQMGLLLATSKEINKHYTDEGSPAALLSLTISMCALSQTAHEDCKDWISMTCNLFHKKLMEEEVSSMSFEMLSICVSAMIISAACGSSFPIDNVLSLASWFEGKLSEIPQCSGISVSCGMLAEALEQFGHTIGADMTDKLQKEWFSTLSSEKRPTLQRLAALNGLTSLYSCGRGLLQLKRKEGTSSNSAIKELTSLAFQMLSAGRDIALQNICSWEVGRLYSVHSFQQETEASVPGSYSYLAEKSVLKPLMKMILSSHGFEETSKADCQQLAAALRSLGGHIPRSLPPLNWMAVLTPFLQQNENPEFKEAALNIALHQAKGSPYAASLLSSYCCPPLFYTLTEIGQKFLLKNLSELAVILQPQKLKVFFQTIVSLILKADEQFETLGTILMQKILNAFEIPGLKSQTLSVLHSASVTIVKQLKYHSELFLKHIKWVSEIICLLPEKAIESVFSLSENGINVANKMSILCDLVRTGRKNLSLLKQCIEEGKHCSVKEQEEICAALYLCFLYGCQNKASYVSQPDKCISWLMETVGWMNVLNDTRSQYQLISIGEVFGYLTNVCLATIVGCGGIECSINLLCRESVCYQSLLENLPLAITKLSTRKEWSSAVGKIIDWLMMLLQSAHISQNDKYYIKLTLCALHNTDEFKKLEVWTNVLSRIY